MKKIPLTQSRFTTEEDDILNPGLKYAIVDDEDYETVARRNWYVDAQGYAVNKTRSITYMHRLIANTPDGMCTDHINGNKLDNRRCNLRICTTQDNMRNRGKQKNNTSGYKGVYWSIKGKKWRAQIIVNKRAIHLGLFATRKEAADAYREAEKKYFGNFSNRMKPI